MIEFRFQHVVATKLAATLLGIVTAAIASAAPIEVVTLNYHGLMPFARTDDTRIAHRINSVIYREVLDMSPPASVSDPMPDVKSSVFPEPVSELSYRVARSDEHILALAVGFVGCGAYCESNLVHFNFEATTGRQLLAADLFTDAGILAVSKRLDLAQIRSWSAQIARLRNVQRHGQVPPTARPGDDVESADSADAAAAMYRTCIHELKLSQSESSRDLGVSSMLITHRGIEFSRERCSNHAMQGLDAVGVIRTSLSDATLKPYLNRYGKTLLLVREKATQ